MVPTLNKSCVTTPPVKSASALCTYLMETDKDKLQELGNIIKNSHNGNRNILNKAVYGFLDVFPRLSLWERFKDFFRLSDTADNQRDMATLCIAETYQKNITNCNDADNAMTFSELKHALKHNGLSPFKCADIDELIAFTTTRLLNREPNLIEHIHFEKMKIETDRSTGAVRLKGLVSFGSHTSSESDVLQRLPFCTTVRSPEAASYSLIELMSDESVISFTTLFQKLPPQTQLQLGLLSETDGSRLFSNGEVLGRVLNDDISVSVETLKDWQAQYKYVYASGLEIPTSGATVVKTPRYEFKHEDIIKPEADREEALLKYLHRGGLKNTILTVNDKSLSKGFSRKMAALAVENDKSSAEDTLPKPGTGVLTENVTQRKLKDISEQWSHMIQNELHTDADTTQKVVAGIMYSLFQGGAGKSNTGMLIKLGPGKLCESIKGGKIDKRAYEQTLDIDTRQTGQMSIRMTEHCIVSYGVARPDNLVEEVEEGTVLRGGGVAMCHSYPMLE